MIFAQFGVAQIIAVFWTMDFFSSDDPHQRFQLVTVPHGLYVVVFPVACIDSQQHANTALSRRNSPLQLHYGGKRETAIWATWGQSVTRRNGLSIPLVLWVMAERVGLEPS